jgi:protein-disulfide isomerase
LNLPPVAEPVLTVSPDDDPSVGPTAAPITIVEFSDFQCPFCKLSAGVLKEVLRAYGDKVRLVYRDYPAPNHIHAGKAAEAAQCAAAQGKFWAYHDLLFEYQQAAGSGWDFIQLAQQVSINLTEFTRCLDTHQYALEVENDLRDALSLGVRSTPTFFVNGRPLIGARSFDEFKQLIDRVLAETQLIPSRFFVCRHVFGSRPARTNHSFTSDWQATLGNPHPREARLVAA